MNRRRKTIVLAAALLAAGAALLMAACNGGGNGSPTPTGVPRTTCKPATPPVFPAPENLPADLQEFQSPDRGYTIRYPADWEAMANKASVQNISGDVFFAPTSGGEVRPNMSVTCETIPIGTDTSTFAEAKREVLQSVLGASPIEAASLDIDGKHALAWHYKVVSEKTPEPTVVEKVEILFADDRGGWIISLVVPEAQVNAYEAMFDAFAASFHEY
jgi:hypothetical protein